ncbi:hypothetical protein Oscil6304_4039 [Oscillatoria acuminata PCC 6304]|uniref:Uncharacterized protein n=2 Tax=Oscillatoria acuminata TaxID=118323 RepID=K9TN37_9CYAN|nr:hypothetical protein Oscil6304_4039 [Oscillatoria acuminata PCC 6304]
MTLNELLPAIHQLNPTDKQKLFELLDRELHPTRPTPTPELQPENFQVALLNRKDCDRSAVITI